MLFSVLMAHYNNAKFLAGSLKSVLNQSYKDWEIIIVDDGSTDEFENVISSYEKDDRIKVFRNKKNMGTAYTKALCVEKANGDIAGYLDPDDLIHPDTLQIMADAHLERPECSIIHSTNYICDDKLNIIRVSECPKPLPKKTPYLLVGDGSIHHFVSFKIECYNRTARLTPDRAYDRASDQELYYLLEEEGEVHFIDKPLHYYRIHQGSISNMGHEHETLKQHYSIIENACLRRLEKLKNNHQPEASYWSRQYRTRYRKIRILNSFRSKQWFSFFANLIIFPFVGGWNNIKTYVGKLPQEGFALIRKSLAGSYNAVK